MSIKVLLFYIWVSNCSSIICWQDCPFPTELSLYFGQKSVVHICIGLFLDSAATVAKSRHSCSTLCDPTDGSPPGSPVPGILQARTLEWVAISFSNAWKWRVKVKSLSHVQLLATPWTAAHQASPSMEFPGKSTGVGRQCLLRLDSLLCSNDQFIYLCANKKLS